MNVVQNLDPKLLQIALTGFLEKNTSLFVKVQSLACVNPELACTCHLAMWNLHPLQSRVICIIFLAAACIQSILRHCMHVQM